AHYNDPDILARVSRGIGEPMRGLAAASLREEERLQVRGW
ncbi:MAG: pyridoxal 5'-phosphate synthase lyase subunit PdxS, partial [Bacillota bacterium]